MLRFWPAPFERFGFRARIGNTCHLGYQDPRLDTDGMCNMPAAQHVHGVVDLASLWVMHGPGI